jgi:hypothetical protein
VAKVTLMGNVLRASGTTIYNETSCAVETTVNNYWFIRGWITPFDAIQPMALRSLIEVSIEDGIREV